MAIASHFLCLFTLTMPSFMSLRLAPTILELLRMQPPSLLIFYLMKFGWHRIMKCLLAYMDLFMALIYIN